MYYVFLPGPVLQCGLSLTDAGVVEGTRLQHSAEGTYPCVTLVGRVLWEGSEGEGQGRGGGEGRGGAEEGGGEGRGGAEERRGRERREGLEGGGEKGGRG